MIASISSIVSLEVVVDDDVVGERQADRLLVLGLAQPLGDLVARGRRARAGAAPARRAIGGSTKISIASGRGALTCWAPSTSISSTTSLPGGGSGQRRAVVVAEELGPLQEAAVGDAVLERRRGR